MTLKKYLNEKSMYLVVNIFTVIITSIFMSILGLNLYTISLISFIYLLGGLIPIISEYLKKREFYNTAIDVFDNIDKKYLACELIEEPDFEEGKIFCDCIFSASKSMNDEISKFKSSSKEYKEYIEMWIHEVKTPIASSKLIIENNKSHITSSLLEEINEIDYYLEQALFYARSYSVEKDYIIKKNLLRGIVNNVIRKNSKILIRTKVRLLLGDLDNIVYTDTKWMEFIINQIVVNAIKYKNENPSIEIYSEKNKNNTYLYIKDNGIGISKKDLSKVFEKGYTGDRGREYAKSTGIGLYLCKKLCDKLGVYISIESKENQGTIVQIVFPQTSMTSVLEG